MKRLTIHRHSANCGKPALNPKHGSQPKLLSARALPSEKCPEHILNLHILVVEIPFPRSQLKSPA